jgi:hypothetical protein
VSINLSIIYPNFDLKYSHVVENIEKWLNLKTSNIDKYELYVNGAAIDWYLAKYNSKIRTSWIDNLQNAESIKLTIQEKKPNVIIILSNDLPSNDVLPQNYARYELNDYYQKNTNWKNVILDGSLSDYVNIYYRSYT